MANAKVNIVFGEKPTKVLTRIKDKMISRDNLCLEDTPLKSIIALQNKIKRSIKAVIKTVYCMEHIPSRNQEKDHFCIHTTQAIVELVRKLVNIQ
jgi:uncharacterized protein YaaR (DUF327 family)